MNFVSEYYPDVDDLTAEQIAAARATVVAALAPAFTDVDLSAGTPTGDLVVGPLSLFAAASDEAHTRLMSDLDLDNVANGVIYSCDFVRRYLGNFGVYDVENARSYGLVRLTFDTPDARTIGKHILFRFGGEDTYALRMSSLTSTEVSLLAAGSALTAAPDTYVLSQTSGTTWAVDLPVEGVMNTPVLRGASGTTTLSLAGLVGISSVTDFLSGMQSASLADLAKYARRAAYALNAGSRYGTMSTIMRNWPESQMVSPVLTGDPELLRTLPSTAMALQTPACDVYYRSERDLQVMTQTFRLAYVEADTDDGAEFRFRGRIPFLHRPSRIVSLEWAGSTSESIVTHTIYSRSSSTEFLGAHYCGTRFEEFYADVVPALTEGLGESRVPILTDDDGQYGLFTVVYLADPMLSIVAGVMESPDYTTPGVSTVVKAGPLVSVNSLVVTYQKEAGVRVLVADAALRIADTFNTAGYPNTLSQSSIHDAMRTAGAKRVLSIQCAGTVAVTPASRKFVESAAISPLEDFITENWGDLSDPFTVLTVTTPEGLVPSTVVSTTHATWLETWAATYRTVRHALSAGDITFVETS